MLRKESKTCGRILFGVAVLALAMPLQAYAQFSFRPADVESTLRQGGRDIDRTVNPVRGDSDVRRVGRDFDRARLDATAGGFRAGRDYTKLHVKNDTAHTVAVALMIDQFRVAGSESTLAYYEHNPDAPFTQKYWVLIAPGQTAYVGDTANVRFYFYAVRSGGGQVWEGTSAYRTLRNGSGSMHVGFCEVMFVRSGLVNYTYSLR